MAAKRSAQVAGNLSMLMARPLELWRMMWILSREATALGFIACVLLPAFSTADDFHICALHGLAMQAHATQLYEPNAGDKADQDPCLTRSRQSVADTAGVASSLCARLQLLCAISVDRRTAEQSETLAPCLGRAPPQYFPF